MNRLGATDRLCETLVSWRLLVGGRLPGASHHSFITSSEEPPLSNFNSYRDIPGARDWRMMHNGAVARVYPEGRNLWTCCTRLTEYVRPSPLARATFGS